MGSCNKIDLISEFVQAHNNGNMKICKGDYCKNCEKIENKQLFCTHSSTVGVNTGADQSSEGAFFLGIFFGDDSFREEK